MRYLALSVMAAVGMFLVSACNDQAKAQEEKAPAPAAPAATAPAAATISAESEFSDKVAYSVGASVGTYIATVQKDQAEVIGQLKQDIIVQGFIDALKGQTVLSDEEIGSTLMDLDNKVRANMEAKLKADAAKNLEEGKKFLAENAKKEGVIVTQSGLQYKIVKQGEGKSPKATDTVSVKYKGTTIDGKVFDEQQSEVSFGLANIIPGWTEGLQLMKEGASFTFYIPSELAYGETGAGDIIKPNSVLIFDVELVKVGEPK